MSSFVALLRISLCLGMCYLLVKASHQILAGRTGNGKSFIATKLGCPRKSCYSPTSCSKETFLCPNRLIDTIGLDDDGEDHKNDYKILYEGKNISLSGLTYPIYSLFDTLEVNKISDVEFYLVSDANNPTGGLTQKFFMKFVTQDLNCSVNTVLNKYRPKIHSSIAGQYDILIPEFPDEVPLKGKNCIFGLAQDWREKVILSDLAGVRSQVNIETCRKLKERSLEYKALQEKRAQDILTYSCSYDKPVGKSGGWSVDLFGAVSFSGGKKMMYERAVDEDCARLRSERSHAIDAANERLHKEKLSLTQIISSVDKGLAECYNLLPQNVEL
jgi:hypothetical protein